MGKRFRGHVVGGGLVLLTIAKSTKLLLPRGIPHVEDEGPPVGVEEQGVHLHANRSDVLLLKLTLQQNPWPSEKCHPPTLAVVGTWCRCAGRQACKQDRGAARRHHSQGNWLSQKLLFALYGVIIPDPEIQSPFPLPDEVGHRSESARASAHL